MGCRHLRADGDPLGGSGALDTLVGNVVSYELGISIIAISIVSMEMALRSNKGSQLRSCCIRLWARPACL